MAQFDFSFITYQIFAIFQRLANNLHIFKYTLVYTTSEIYAEWLYLCNNLQSSYGHDLHGCAMTSERLFKQQLTPSMALYQSNELLNFPTKTCNTIKWFHNICESVTQAGE
jgi:hypothetical protein